MSMRFLQGLNGNRAPAFTRLLAGFEQEPNICWYPSAGHDFRDLLYLSRAYAAHDPAIGPEADPPDLFLHTDYHPWEYQKFSDGGTVFRDERTEIRVQGIEEVGRLPLPLHDELVYFPEPNDAYGRVLYLRLKVSSKRFGDLPDVHLVYACVENAALCAEVLIPRGARLSHLINVRYQCGWGGGSVKSRGNWLSGVIGRLGVRTLITDRPLSRLESGDQAVLKIYPALSGPDGPPRGHTIRTVPSVRWAWGADVSWVRVGDGA